MKKILLSVLFVAGVFGVRAQFFKKVVDNVKQTVQNRANNKADATTNKAIDKVDKPGSGSGPDTASTNKVLRAFGKAANDNPNDTSAADLTMKMLKNLVGGGGVSAADSARAIQAYRSADGGSGIFYQMVTIMTGKMNRRDTSGAWITSGGEGRKEMSLFGSGRIVTIGRIVQPTYSITLDEEEKTFSLNVIDTSLINNAQTYKVERLGNETAAGYPCTHVRVTSRIGKGMFASSSVSELWLSTAVPGYSMLKNGILEAGQQIGMMKALHQAGVDGFFVKMTAAGKDYAITIALTQIKEGHFPASLFSIPSGYAQSNEGMVGSLMRAGMKQKP